MKSLRNGWDDPVWKTMYGNDPAGVSKALVNKREDDNDPAYIQLLKEGARRNVPLERMTMQGLDRVMQRKLQLDRAPSPGPAWAPAFAVLGTAAAPAALPVPPCRVRLLVGRR